MRVFIAGIEDSWDASVMADFLMYVDYYALYMVPQRHFCFATVRCVSSDGICGTYYYRGRTLHVRLAHPRSGCSPPDQNYDYLSSPYTFAPTLSIPTSPASPMCVSALSTQLHDLQLQFRSLCAKLDALCHNATGCSPSPRSEAAPAPSPILPPSLSLPPVLSVGVQTDLDLATLSDDVTLAGSPSLGVGLLSAAGDTAAVLPCHDVASEESETLSDLFAKAAAINASIKAMDMQDAPSSPAKSVIGYDVASEESETLSELFAKGEAINSNIKAMYMQDALHLPAKSVMGRQSDKDTARVHFEALDTDVF